MVSIKFHGTRYILIGTLTAGGALATVDAFRSGKSSYAHLYPNGNIQRFGEIIGTREDLIVLKRIKKPGLKRVAYRNLCLRAKCLTR